MTPETQRLRNDIAGFLRECRAALRTPLPPLHRLEIKLMIVDWRNRLRTAKTNEKSN